MHSNETNQEKQALAPKRARTTLEKISQHEIDDLNERHHRIIHAAADVARQVIELGELLRSAKKKVRHGKWIPWVEHNLCFQMRTVQRYMKAAERKYDPILGIDPAEFMARIWGNEPKQLEEGEEDKKDKNDVDVAFDSDDEEDEDTSQHGGPGFEPSFFKDKGKPDFFNFKSFVTLLEQHFFGSQEITTQAKLDFGRELLKWLEHRLQTLTSQQDRERNQ